MISELSKNPDLVAGPLPAPGRPSASSVSAETAISLRRASLGYGPAQVVLRDVNIDLDAGSCLAVLGPSGVGKSTILKTIAGLLPLLEGEICLFGQEVSQLAPEDREAPILFQDLRLFPHLSVFENVAFPLRIRKWPAVQLKAAVARELDRFGLSAYAQKSPSTLSGGEQQRVALARAIVFRPRILLLDEAFSGLDLELRQRLRQELKAVQTELGLTLVFVTHDLTDALYLADNLAILGSGHICSQGTKNEVLADPAAQAYLQPWKEELRGPRSEGLICSHSGSSSQ